MGLKSTIDRHPTTRKREVLNVSIGIDNFNPIHSTGPFTGVKKEKEKKEVVSDVG